MHRPCMVSSAELSSEAEFVLCRWPLMICGIVASCLGLFLAEVGLLESKVDRQNVIVCFVGRFATC